jgi:hypothetical protein
LALPGAPFGQLECEQEDSGIHYRFDLMDSAGICRRTHFTAVSQLVREKIK